MFKNFTHQATTTGGQGVFYTVPVNKVFVVSKCKINSSNGQSILINGLEHRGVDTEYLRGAILVAGDTLEFNMFGSVSSLSNFFLSGEEVDNV